VSPPTQSLNVDRDSNGILIPNHQIANGALTGISSESIQQLQRTVEKQPFVASSQGNQGVLRHPSAANVSLGHSHLPPQVAGNQQIMQNRPWVNQQNHLAEIRPTNANQLNYQQQQTASSHPQLPRLTQQFQQAQQQLQLRLQQQQVQPQLQVQLQRQLQPQQQQQPQPHQQQPQPHQLQPQQYLQSQQPLQQQQHVQPQQQVQLQRQVQPQQRQLQPQQQPQQPQQQQLQSQQLKRQQKQQLQPQQQLQLQQQIQFQQQLITRPIDLARHSLQNQGLQRPQHQTQAQQMGYQTDNLG
jgi:hypothetical protein